MRARTFLVTWGAYASYYFCRKNFSVSKAAIQDELGLSTRMLGAVDTGDLAAYAIPVLGLGGPLRAAARRITVATACALRRALRRRLRGPHAVNLGARGSRLVLRPCLPHR